MMGNQVSGNRDTSQVIRIEEQTTPAAGGSRPTVTNGQQRATSSAPPPVPKETQKIVVAYWTPKSGNVAIVQDVAPTDDELYSAMETAYLDASGAKGLGFLGSAAASSARTPEREEWMNVVDAFQKEVRDSTRELKKLGMERLEAGDCSTASVLILALKSLVASGAEHEACMQSLEALLTQLVEPDQTEVAGLISDLRAPRIKRPKIDIAALRAEAELRARASDDETPARKVRNCVARWRTAGGSDVGHVTSIIKELSEELAYRVRNA